MTGTAPVNVILVGVHGYGRRHLDEVLRLGGGSPGGPVALAGLVDPVPPDRLPEPLRSAVAQVPSSTRLEPLLAATPPPVLTIVATPLHTHVPIAVTALEQGSAVLLEKPPATSVAEFRTLLNAAETHRGVVQVGFQDVASPALAMMAGLIADGQIGSLIGVGAAGAWSRDSTYYARSRWAGRRRLDGVDVVDGALTNPFAHAVAAAIRVAGSSAVEDVLCVETELYRANPIEADDTSCVRITTRQGTPVVIAGTLCARTPQEPVVIAHGTRGRIEWRYKLGELLLLPADGGDARLFRSDPPRPLANLVDHLRDATVPLLVPLVETGAFTAVLDAIRRAPDPHPIPAEDVTVLGVPPAEAYEDPGETAAVRRVVPGVAALVHRAADDLLLFSELGVPWAVAPSLTGTRA